MKIYYSASISGGREYAAIFQKTVDFLKEYGNVLTEHIGAIELTAQGETQGSDAEIFQRDIDWLDQADMVIADVTTPSLGVGYEIAYALQRKIPVIACFYEKSGRRLSAMIAGNPKLKVILYQNLTDLFDKLSAAF
jgi:2'-deoxynucleoside 5'-phosphate N-hydrolase